MHTADAVQVAGVATSVGGLERQGAAYVRRRAGDRLWAADAARVHALLGAGDRAGAIAAYFRGVGRRWAQERLVVKRLDPELRGEAVDG